MFLFGPQAVGKMTIGEELSKRLEIPLLFNHMTLDILTPFLGWSADTFRISQQIRCDILEAVANNPSNNGMIMTFGMYWDAVGDRLAFNRYREIFESRGIEVCLVELEADFDERLRRNKTENRLSKKPSKRDIEYSEQELKASYEKHRLNSNPGEIDHSNYFSLDVTDLSVYESADAIMERFWQKK